MRRLKVPPDSTTELNHNAYLFLQSVFDKHDKVKSRPPAAVFILALASEQLKRTHTHTHIDTDHPLSGFNSLSAVRD